MSNLKVELQNLYSDSSKHSSYQSVPSFVTAEIGYEEVVRADWRGDRPRLDYLLAHREPAEGERWLDFGANTGFFTLSLAHQHRGTEIFAVEANPNHSRFIERVADYFELKNVCVIPRAIGLGELSELPATDVMLHLNVLHHAGHDFDAEAVKSREDFETYAHEYLSALSDNSGAMLFQMGSNWGGDKLLPLVEVLDDLRKLKVFRSYLIDSNWRIDRISYPSKGVDGNISYLDISDAMDQDAFLGLDAFPGEFHRRPLFWCESILRANAAP